MAAVNDLTKNFALELPHPDNHMPEDCERIRNALMKLDAELLKELAKYLPLTGGTLTGTLRLKAAFDTNDVATGYTGQTIFFTDKNGVQVGYITVQTTKDDGRQVTLYVKRGNIPAALSLIVDKNGKAYATLPTPEETAPLKAALNKEAADRDYVKKAGDEMSAGLTIRAKSFVNDSSFDGVTDEDLLIFRDKKGVAALNCRFANIEPGSYKITFLLGLGLANDMLYSSLTMGREDSRTYIGCSSPRSAYNIDIVNNIRLIDYTLQKLTGTKIVHVGGANASDTADINNGRGLSADKPFATLLAAINWARQYFSGDYSVVFVLHDNFTLADELQIFAGNFNAIFLQSASSSAIKTITIPEGKLISVQHGQLFLQNIAFHGNNAANIFSVANSLAMLAIGNGVTFSGSVKSETDSNAVIRAVGGSVSINKAIGGTMTGKRYDVVGGGKIITYGKGPNVIPGTEEGTSDSSSVYA